MTGHIAQTHSQMFPGLRLKSVRHVLQNKPNVDIQELLHPSGGPGFDLMGRGLCQIFFSVF